MSLRAAFLALLLLASSPTAGLSEPAGQAAVERRLEIFDFVWSEIRDRYYDRGFNGTDWTAVRLRYRPLAAAAADDAAFQSVLRLMTGELRDSHTRVLSALQARDRRRDQSTTTGVILFEVEGRPILFDVRPGSPAGDAGLIPGMAVEAVNGVPVAEALAAARGDVGPSSSERAALVHAYLRLIAGPLEQPLRLDLVDAAGTRRSVSLSRVALDAAPRFEARRLPEGPLYIKFDRFREPVARLLRQALIEHSDSNGLILDLRSNTGGDGREGMRAVSPLLDRPTLMARLRTRTGRAPTALLGLARLPLELKAGQSGRRLFSGPVVILVNQGTASTSEVIAASLQEQKRAKVLGVRSCGCALGVLRYRRLANGGALAISEIGLVTAAGRRIEGDGVTPDLTVELKLNDLRQGRDRVLEAAVEDILRR